jgi:hypothetical protein
MIWINLKVEPVFDNLHSDPCFQNQFSVSKSESVIGDRGRVNHVLIAPRTDPDGR